MTKYVEKVSIIMLTYNNWRLIEKAISSVMEQTYENIELIISDDGTIDFNSNYIKAILRKSKNKTIDTIVLANLNNIGTVKSFNSAIKKATGDLIIPLSADDLFSDSKVVSDLVNEFNMRKCKLLTGLRRPFDTTKDLEVLPDIKERKYFHNCNELLYRLIINGNFISGASTYYHRSVFESIGFFDEKYKLLEDYPFYIKALSKGIMIELFEREVIQYSLGGVSTSKVRHPALLIDFKTVTLVILKESNLSFFDRRRVFYRFFLTKKEKLLIQSFFKYPDQAITFFFSKFLSKFS